MTQLQRIAYIMSNDNITTCDHCKRSYIPLGADTCPFCRGDEALNNELREIERLELEGGDNE